MLLALTLAACTTDKQETPPTTSAPETVPPTTSSTGPPPRPSAPSVPRPLNAGGLVLDPCRSLTQEQRTALGVISAEFTDLAPEGAGCSFERGGDSHATVVFAANVRIGLDYVYAQNSSSTWDYWAPTTVEGYPAVGYNAIVDSQSRLCNFAVGISDRLYFWVTADAQAGNSRCQLAQSVASAVLATIRARS
ncbi:hypothetical protein BU204_01060 [Actinophytocola xanthii]|uniref:DUF3558 domain-containing protein n=1 Tax=Actinophytocola xanthii TaxID=1912961 RepID=A0A1Q8CYW7_9PSEU|nr:hypothetical protein BU204_01060 [Actinophytocola xanthii]